MMDYQPYREYLLKISDELFDREAKDLVKKWDDPPKALQILEVLDKCVCYSWSSSFEIKVLDILYRDRLSCEGVSNEDVVKLASWRADCP